MIKILVKNKKGQSTIVKTILKFALYILLAAVVISILYAGATKVNESLGIVKKCDCLTCTNCDQLACANCPSCNWESNACQSVAAPG